MIAVAETAALAPSALLLQLHRMLNYKRVAGFIYCVVQLLCHQKRRHVAGAQSLDHGGVVFKAPAEGDGAGEGYNSARPRCREEKENKR